MCNGRYCSTHPGGPQRVPLEAADGALKLGWSRREVLEDYYERWVRLSPHVLGHSKAHVAKLVGELVRAGRATGGIPESSLAFRGDFLQVEEQTEVREEGKEDLKDEVKEEMKGESSEDGGRSGVPRCSLETPRRGDWLRKHRGGVYRLTPDSVLRWFYPAVQRCLATVRYPFEQRCTLSLALADDRVQLRLTPRSDYVCCHISMAIRLLPAIPLGDGVYLVPMETTASVAIEERDLWTLFFPRQEQRLLGWLRGRSPQPSCHLKVLQLTKALRDLGGQALDSHRGALWRSVLSSYTLKTAWLRLLLSSPAEVGNNIPLIGIVEVGYNIPLIGTTGYTIPLIGIVEVGYNIPLIGIVEVGYNIPLIGTTGYNIPLIGIVEVGYNIPLIGIVEVGYNIPLIGTTGYTIPLIGTTGYTIPLIGTTGLHHTFNRVLQVTPYL
uniref:Inositol 1,4,5-trisphosphate receptor-interacting protein-like 2 n=1 Tax=Salmo trutta TaxID=8032 RepID=A0A674D283_SALTR